LKIRLKISLVLILLSIFIACTPTVSPPASPQEIDISYIEAQLDSQINSWHKVWLKTAKTKTSLNWANDFKYLPDNSKDIKIRHLREWKSNDIFWTIGNLDIVANRINISHLCCTRAQNSFSIYNRSTRKIYFWLPFEWAQYVSDLDSNIIKIKTIKTVLAMATRSNTLAKQELYGFIDTHVYPEFVLSNSYSYYYIADSLPYLAYSLNKTAHFEVLSNIFNDMYFADKKSVDTLLQLLQSQHKWDMDVNCKCFHITAVSDTCPIAKQKPKYKADQYIIWDGENCQSIKSITAGIHDTNIDYMRISIERFDTMSILLSNGYKENLTDIKKYVKETKPTFIYYKKMVHNFRTSYNYFIFYYIDFVPFMPPRLRDMQVVFPRMFGLF
jgi:hypothetical protein